MNVTTLANKPKNKNIIKIAITQSTKTKSELKSTIVSKIKNQMIKNNIVTLVNCSPLKLLNAGCQCFLNKIDYNDPDEQQIISYLQNAIKCQLAIQQTIVDIQLIKKQNKKIFILCDTNSMDTKINIQSNIWNKFLRQYQIDEYKLQNNYDFVFHIKDLIGRNAIVDKENQIIANNWKEYNNYYTITFNQNLTFQQNVREGVNKIQEILLSCLSSDFKWQKLQQKN